MQADEQMIETEAVAYIKTTNANSGLLVDTLVLPNTKPTKTMILCHGAGKNKAYFQNLNATYGFAPTANVRIMLPTSNHYAGKKTPWFLQRTSEPAASLNRYKLWSVDESADAIARVI
jgi:hypothetical protein